MAVSQTTLTALRSPTNSWALWDETFPKTGCLCETPARIVQFLTNSAADLRPDVVFVGYNPTRAPGQLAHPFQSFHLPSSLSRYGRDGRLKRLVQDDLTYSLRGRGVPNRLAGAFITDVYPDSPGSSVKDTEVQDRGDQHASFLEKLCTLLADPYFPEPRTLTLIAFGRSAWTSLLEAIGMSYGMAALSAFPFKRVHSCKTFASSQVQDDFPCPSGPLKVRLVLFGIWHYSSRRSNRCILRQLECINSLIGERQRNR